MMMSNQGESACAYPFSQNFFFKAEKMTMTIRVPQRER